MNTGRLKALIGVSVLTLVSGISSFVLAGTASAQGTPPWEPDPVSVGGLLFYNAAGQQVTGGSVTGSPVAAYVEGTSTVRSGDSVATLYGYLPVKGQPTSKWSGQQLGLSTTFPNASAPAPLNTATLPVETGHSGDENLSTLGIDFPQKGTGAYAGMYQLRLYTNAPHKSQTTAYDSADILITGSTWSVVYPVPQQAPTITTGTSTTFVKGVAGSFTVKATGSPAPTFSETGALPGGVTLSSAGALTGTPTATGTFPITITASNGVSPNATQSFSLKVVGVQITNAKLAQGTVGTLYSATLNAVGGATPYTWSLSTGTLPAGLTLSATKGTITGTPTTAGSSTVVIKVKTTKTTTTSAYTGTKKFTITVVA
jgi:hypothetical protein